MAACALHSVPHSPRTAFLAVHTLCLCFAGMRPPRAASLGRLGPRSGASPAAVVPEWAGGTEPGLTPSAAGPDPPAQASRAPAGAHHVRRGSLARARRRREHLPGSVWSRRSVFTWAFWCNPLLADCRAPGRVVAVAWEPPLAPQARRDTASAPLTLLGAFDGKTRGAAGVGLAAAASIAA